MSPTSIRRPGEPVASTPAELLNLEGSEEVVSKWQERMQNIEESERSAENEEASIRIR